MVKYILVCVDVKIINFKTIKEYAENVHRLKKTKTATIVIRDIKIITLIILAKL